MLPDKEGKPYTVRYEAVNAMLLNEFLKEHKAFVEEQRKVEQLQATVVKSGDNGERTDGTNPEREQEARNE